MESTVYPNDIKVSGWTIVRDGIIVTVHAENNSFGEFVMATIEEAIENYDDPKRSNEAIQEFVKRGYLIETDGEYILTQKCQHLKNGLSFENVINELYKLI